MKSVFDEWSGVVREGGNTLANPQRWSRTEPTVSDSQKTYLSKRFRRKLSKSGGIEAARSWTPPRLEDCNLLSHFVATYFKALIIRAGELEREVVKTKGFPRLLTRDDA